MQVPVWIYWEGDCPEWIRCCRQTITHWTEDVRLVTPEIFEAWREKDITLDHLCIPHRADFIRAFLLAEFGGFWIDSDALLMRSLQPLTDLLDEYEFISYRERGGNIANSFMAARPSSRIARTYYERICGILRSGQPINWLTLGSDALTAVIGECGLPWYEIPVEMVQPICWSDPRAFFTHDDEEAHAAVFNPQAWCYMLSANMINGVLRDSPGTDLLEEGSFFSFLLRKALQDKYRLIRGKLTEQAIDHRQGTDDDIWVIPEVIDQDMYRVRDVLKKLEPPEPAWVIDCGAHIGAFSIMCARHLKQAEVISYEPNPDSYYYLQKNAERYGHIQAVNKAIGMEDGTLQLYAPDQSDWNGRWTTIPNQNSSLTVEAEGLAGLILRLEKPVFILKLDLEGYEDQLISHLPAEALERIRMIIVETHTDRFDHARLIQHGFQSLFQPAVSAARQFVYLHN